jgi:outer membrane biosynthesis protein TonB
LLQPTTNPFREALRFPEGLSHRPIPALRLLLLFMGMLYLAACAPSPSSTLPPVTASAPEDVAAAATPSPTDSPTIDPTAAPVDEPTEAPVEAAEPTAEPIAEPTETPVPEAVDWTETVTVDGDLFIRGNPAAPIRLVDYSDFM